MDALDPAGRRDRQDDRQARRRDGRHFKGEDLVGVRGAGAVHGERAAEVMLAAADRAHSDPMEVRPATIASSGR